MKILLLNIRYTPYSNSICSGGVEFVLSKQLSLLAGHEVVLFTDSDSEDCVFPHVKTFKSSVESKYKSDLSGLEYNKRRNADLARCILSFKPDVILNHDQSNNSILKLLEKSNIPSITYVHNCFSVMGGMIGVSYLSSLESYRDSGGLIVNVSETSKNEWNSFSKKYLKKEIFLDHQYCLSFNEEDYPLMEKKPNSACMISRMNKDKNIHKAIQHCQKNGIQFSLYHTYPRKEDEIQYFNKINSYKFGNLYCDMERSSLLESVSKNEILYVCGPESFGIVQCEAYMMGIRVELLYEKDHPYHEIKAIIDIREGDSPEEIRKKTSTFFNKENSISRLEAIIERSINMFLSNYRRKDEEISLFEF